MCKNLFRTVLFLGTVALGAAWSLAGDLNDDLKLLDSNKGDNTAKPASKSGTTTAASLKDPVELALAIPKKFHIKYDDLRQDQKTAYDAMKKQYAPKLKEAIDKVKEAAEADKAKASKEVKTLKKEVATKIMAILNQRNPTAKPVKQQQPIRRGRNGRPY